MASTPSPSNDALFAAALRLGDNNLILGQQLARWIGHGPELEEEMATANVVLDLIGHARAWLTLAGEIEGRGRDEDQLAFFRGSGSFFNALLVEQPNGNFADTIMRQYFYDAWHYLYLRALTGSADARFSALAQKAVIEVDYHLKRSRQWVLRLGDGTPVSHEKMVAALDRLWRFTGELFEDHAVDEALAAAGVTPLPSSLLGAWQDEVFSTLRQATLTVPENVYMQSGGRRGVHGEHHGYILAEMQSLPRTFPDARW